MENPLELYEVVRLLPGELPEITIDYPNDELPMSFVMPAHSRYPESGSADTVYVPTYEIARIDEEVEAVVTKVEEAVKDDAWLLLLAVSDKNQSYDGPTREAVEAKIRVGFANLFGVPSPDSVEMYTCERDGRVVAVYRPLERMVVMVVRTEPTVMHLQPLNPCCWIDCGFAVLDSRVVLGGKVEKSCSLSES